MQPTSFQHLALFIRKPPENDWSTLQNICQQLSQHQVTLISSEDNIEPLHKWVKHESLEEIAENADLAVSIGGDGTLLAAARQIVDLNIPLIGINLGRLGFLADITVNNLKSCLQGIFQGQYIEEKRFLLQGEISHPDGKIFRAIAFNDIVLHSHPSISMIEFQVQSNGRLINTLRADGLIVSTPTGSTAYALSGGGPIIHPSMESLALVPVCPHTLSNRPIVLPSDREIEISMLQKDRNAQISFDGQTPQTISEDHKVKVRRFDREITLLHPESYDYFHILREKLKWSTNPDA